MRRAALLFALLICLLDPRAAAAQELYRLAGMVPLLPMSEGVHEDIDTLVAKLWPRYFNAPGPQGFTSSQLRVGRVDLDGDGKAELVVMIDSPAWENDKGKPFVVANWTRSGWRAVGWGFGDDDSVFITGEVLNGWVSIDTPRQWLRFDGKAYRAEDKPQG
ncbi:MAG: hypothetical protein ACM31L_19965 [Actinomycetota bacterium]